MTRARIGRIQLGNFDDLFAKADIVDVARRLGLQIDRKQTRPRRALCPFHNDTTPSLNLYQRGNGDNPHYHCFACGAHGDLVGLIRGVKGLTFTAAVQWLAEELGVTLPADQIPRVETHSAITALTSLVTKARSARFAPFCKTRGFSAEFLRSRGIGVISLNGLVERARHDKILAESLIEAGIARTDEATGPQDELWRGGIRGFFGGDRVVFQIDGADGAVAGFAARALGEEHPKYLYTSRFARKRTLYGANDVLRRLWQVKEDRGNFSLTIVEGIFDALRLASLDLPAVAVLGSSLTADQADVLKQILARAREVHSALRIDLFLDPDEAGRKGAFTSAAHLFKIQAECGPFDLRMIVPASQAGAKDDPDTYLRDKTRDAALESIEAAAVPALIFLANHMMRRPVRTPFGESSPGERAMAARRIVESVDRTGIAYLLEQFEPPEEWIPFVDSLRVFMHGRLATLPAAAPRAEVRPGIPPESRSALLRALELGRSTTLRREYPFDDAAWDRLSVAASGLYHVHAARLASDYLPSRAYLAREVPKGGGRMRLKCGPVAEDLLLQLYVLQELLRSHAASDLIPAIRSDADGNRLLTGPQALREGKAREAVSFAYQVDMAITDRLTPPDRAGLFRSYYHCWRDFIEHIDRRLARMPYEIVHVVRLDISGFYDNVRRVDVRDALQGPLRHACEKLDALGEPLVPLLSPGRTPTERADEILNFLLQHSFGYLYTNPLSATEERFATDRGLPQGPDLSAYLANVVLFDLDAMMVDEVEVLDSRARVVFERTDACGGAYARYVDDIVLVCPDGATARRLQRQIEAYLARKGLRLNHKNATPPPMTRRESRLWLTANRTGFGFSGPISETLPLAFFDPLADAGDVPVDRKLALSLLHDPGLDDAAVYLGENGESAAAGEKRSGALGRIRSALSAAELRHNDRISAYRRLWLMAAADKCEGEIASQFAAVLFDVEGCPDTGLKIEEAHDRAVAIYDAMERVMRIDLSLAEAENRDRQTLITLRDKLARSQPHRLADLAAEAVFARAGEDGKSACVKFLQRFDIAGQRLVIVNASFAQVQDLDGTTMRSETIRRGIAPTHFGSLWTTLGRYVRDAMPMKEEAPVERDSPARAVFGALHQDISGIERWASLAGETTEEVTPPNPDFGSVIGEATSPLLVSANSIRSVWLRNEIGVPDEQHRDAAAALINMASRSLGRLFEGWPQLLPILLGEQNHNRLRAIPQPPGLRVNIALLIDDVMSDNRKITLVEFSEENGDLPEQLSDRPPLSAVGIDWGEPKSPVKNLRIFEAALGDFEPMVEKDHHYFSPAAISDTYRGLFRSLPPVEYDRQIIPTAYSFFVREDGTKPQYRIICWTAPDIAANSHAFVRHGDGLQVVEVPERDAQFWRFGWAVCDLFDHVEAVRGDLDADGETGATHAALIAHAIIRRTMRRLVGPDRFGAGVSHKPGEPPSRIARALNLLDAHSAVADDAAGAATIAAAAFAHGVMTHERIERPGYHWRQGGLAALLRRAALRGARVLRRTAENWVGELIFDSAGLRRGVATWLALAERLGAQAAKLSDAPRIDLGPLIAGCRLEAITLGVRRLALDLVALGGAETLAGLAALKPDVSALQDLIGPDLVLVETDEEALDLQVEALYESLATIVIHGKEPTGIITALGWAVLVGTLLDLIPRVQTGPDLLRPRVPVGVHGDEASAQALKFLIAVVATRNDRAAQNENEPQDIFLPFVAMQTEQWLRARDALQTLDAAAGLRVETMENEQAPLDRRTTDTGRPVLILPDRREFVLAPWCVNRANLQGDSFAPEARRRDNQRIFRFTTVFSAGSPISVDVVSIQFAKAAFGDAMELVSAAAKHEQSPVKSSLPREPQLAVAGDDLSSPSNSTAQSGENPASSDGTEQSPQASSETPEIVTAPPPGATSSSDSVNIRMISKEREAAWKLRARVPGMHRVALLQWDVCDTYRFPEENDGLVTVVWDAVNERFTANAVARPPVQRATLSGHKKISVQEFRRRRILEAAIEACNAFRVEGLVLPEYSTRPETVNWLVRQLERQEHPMAIWAGTFRVPSGQTLAFEPTFSRYRHGSMSNKISGANPDYSAVIPCVYRVPMDRRGFEAPSGTTRNILIQDRLKRHPSVAVDELIRPLDKDWVPLFADMFWGHMHLQSFTAELVCSEIFLHASSGNIPGAVAAAQRLQERLGISGNRSPDIIRKEIEDFSRYTSFQESSESGKDRDGQLQRTVMIVPAMTSRSADYHIFGQNHHLAAGLITVFVNATSGSEANGESCFIGHNAWNDIEVKDCPYGDVGPGVFHFQRDKFGPLGTNEAAMVIADIDPIHSTDHKPRPHFQPRPLRLVAHLPLIFATRLRKGATSTEPGDYPVGHRVIRREAIPSDGHATDFVTAMLKAWRPAADKCRDGLFEHSDVTRALEILERFADDPRWLIKRRESLQKRSHLYPYRSVPPPALADWIFVDDSWPTDEEILRRFADAGQWTEDDPWLAFPELGDDGTDKT